MLDQPVKNLIRRQAFVNIDCDGNFIDGERRANVSLSARDAERQLHGLRAGRRRNAHAVIVAADE